MPNMFSGTMGEKGSTTFFFSLIEALSFKHKPEIA